MFALWDITKSHWTGGDVAEAARVKRWRTHLIVLLAGEAGLRCGEIVGLEWRDVDLAKRQLCVRQSDWRGQLTAPKNGRIRYVPLTQRVTSVLKEYRHLRSLRVLCKDNGEPLTRRPLGVAYGGLHGQRMCQRVFTSSGTVSVRIWQCTERRDARFRSWQGMENWVSRSGTCI